MQSWHAANWHAAEYHSLDWFATNGGGIARTLSILATQDNQYAGSSRWHAASWHAANWHAFGWHPGDSGWRLTAGVGIQQFTTTFDIPALNIVPQWIFRTQVGNDAQLNVTQENQTGLLRFIHTHPAADRFAHIASVQGDQVSNIRMTFTLNPLSRSMEINAKQDGDTLTMEFNHVFSGAGEPKRYGRK